MLYYIFNFKLFSFNAKRLDITEYPEYYHYSEHIPVVLINDKEICRHKVEEQKIYETLLELKAERII